MHKLSIRKCDEPFTYRVGHDKRHVVVRASDRQAALTKGRREWRKVYGTEEQK